MHGVVTMGTGDYDQLRYESTLPRPVPGPGEVLLRVLAAGINNTDINTRLGWYSSAVSGGTADQVNEQSEEIDDGGWNASTPFPIIQGTDCCGRVVQYGDGVGESHGMFPRVGQRCLVRPCMRVNGFADPQAVWMASDFDGAFAQYVVVPAHEIFGLSDDLDISDAEIAAVPCAYGTAENMLHRVQVKRGDHVLVTGASGGVGTATVQLAKRRGATVTAVVGKSKMEDFATLLKPDRVLERGEDVIRSLGERSVDVVVDNVAGPEFGALFKLLVVGGRYVSSGAIAGPIVSLDLREVYLKDIRIQGCTAWAEPVFPNLISYLENNEIRPVVARTFALQDIALAQRAFMEKSHIGKFVLKPPDKDVDAQH